MPTLNRKLSADARGCEPSSALHAQQASAASLVECCKNCCGCTQEWWSSSVVNEGMGGNELLATFDCVLDASEFLEIILEFLVCDLVLPEEIGLWDFILEGVYDLPRVDVFDFRLREIEQLLLIHV